MSIVELSGVIPVTAIYAGLHGLLAVALAPAALEVALSKWRWRWRQQKSPLLSK